MSGNDDIASDFVSFVNRGGADIPANEIVVVFGGVNKGADLVVFTNEEAGWVNRVATVGVVSDRVGWFVVGDESFVASGALGDGDGFSESVVCWGGPACEGDVWLGGVC